MSRYSEHDAYVDTSTGVLRNLIGITDQSLLEIAEANLVAARVSELSVSPVGGQFDLLHLRSIHRFLFRDLYEWAGELRTVDISKGDNRFAHHAYLESASKPIFDGLRSEKHLAGLNAGAFCVRVAFYLGELNALHPFREGNGRTQREFISLLARKNGYAFTWTNVDRAELLKASIQSFKGDLIGLVAILQGVIRGVPL
jgi:cell filamentation protein